MARVPPRPVGSARSGSGRRGRSRRRTRSPVVIDPGRAFGTGAHATTRLCLELLLRSSSAASLLDVGCGSGVLSIAAAKLGFAPVAAVDLDAAASRRPRANAAANGVDVEARLVDALADPLAADAVVANIALDVVERLARRLERATRRHLRLSRSRDEPQLPGCRRARAARRATAGRPTCSGASSIARRWRRSRSASSAARSRTSDAHDVRERLLRRRARRGGRRRRRGREHVLRHERGRARSRARRAARAARTHRRVYVTGCGANLAGGAFAGLPENVVVVARRSEETPAFVAGDVGAIGCVQADARLDRVRAFVKVQDGCSFSCNFCVIPLVRGASRSRRAEAVLARDRAARRAGAPRGRPHRDQPRLLPRPRGRLRPAAARARGGRDARARSAAALVDRGQPRQRRARRARCARRRPSRGTCTSRSSRATTACCARWAAATPRRPTCGVWRRSRTST